MSKGVKSIDVNFPKPKDFINEKFVPLLKCEDRWMILYGSRASSKSTFVSQYLIIRLMTENFFRCLSLRLIADSIKESSFRSLCDTISNMNLDKLFTITTSPMKITCLNGNYITFNGLDHPEKLKSLSDISCIHWEEDVPESYSSYVTISNSLRSRKARFIQEIYSLNPVIPDYKNNWFWKMFFEGETELSFRKKFVSEDKETGNMIEQWATIHHSTWRDNRYLPAEFALQMDLLSNDPYLYTTNNLGLWADKMMGGNFYKKFDIKKHIKDVIYNPDKPLFISIDFNVKPHFSILVSQINDKDIFIIDEMAIKHPYNYTREAINVFKNKYRAHKGRVFVMGDAAGYQRDTSQEKGFDNWKIVFAELNDYFKVEDLTKRQNPSVEMRGQFINTIFESGYEGISLYIHSKCQTLITDLMYGGEAPDGGKLKQKVKDKETGETYEKHHHFSDCLDYLICSVFEKEYGIFKSPMKFEPIIGKRTHKNAW